MVDRRREEVYFLGVSTLAHKSMGFYTYAINRLRDFDIYFPLTRVLNT